MCHDGFLLSKSYHDISPFHPEADKLYSTKTTNSKIKAFGNKNKHNICHVREWITFMLTFQGLAIILTGLLGNEKQTMVLNETYVW